MVRNAREMQNLAVGPRVSLRKGKRKAPRKDDSRQPSPTDGQQRKAVHDKTAAKEKTEVVDKFHAICARQAQRSRWTKEEKKAITRSEALLEETPGDRHPLLLLLWVQVFALFSTSFSPWPFGSPQDQCRVNDSINQ